MAGKFYSANLTTAAGEDLMTQFRTNVGESSAVIKALTLIADSELSIKINEGVYSLLYLDTDGKYKLALPNGTCLISSIITQEAGVVVWLAGAY